MCGCDLHPHGAGVFVSGGGYGVVFAARAGMATVHYPGRRLLPGRPARCPGSPERPGDLQHRPGQPVHQPGLDASLEGRGHSDFHGRQRRVAGQCVYRAAMAIAQAGMRVSERI